MAKRASKKEFRFDEMQKMLDAMTAAIKSLSEHKPNAHLILLAATQAVNAFNRSIDAALKAAKEDREIDADYEDDSIRIRKELEDTIMGAVEGKPEALQSVQRLTKELKANTRLIKADLKR
jgi:hypothetical protein